MKAALSAAFMDDLKNCRLCPRKCGTDRTTVASGYCRSGSGYYIGAITLHHGEEPVISGPGGICNVFFSNCNLRCQYCQNHQISGCYGNSAGVYMTLDAVINEITGYLDTGVPSVGFVSPSHCIPQMVNIIEALHARDYHPVIIMNSNAYDAVSTLERLEGLVDVYLPDFKYMDANLAGLYSGATDYPAVAMASVREMLRQKGTTLRIDNGYAVSGLIIRHLVLPGHKENSIAVLEAIADHLSTDIHISLMSQYYPAGRFVGHPIMGRPISSQEYEEVIQTFEKLGFHRGWVQELQSHQNYRPDFLNEDPFTP